jgi:hypothetical protein
MRERFFEAEQMNTKKAVQRDLEDAGISHPSEWRKALDLETPLEGEEPLKVERSETKIETKEGKIENESWQRQLDVAFEQGNYSLIQTLRRVRPESIPNPELLRNKLNELVVSRPSRWEETYRAIREISNLEPTHTIIEGEFSKLFEKYGREKGILDNLKTLAKTTGFVPSSEYVQAKYSSIIKGEKSYDFSEEELFKNVRELTGIKPDASLIHDVIELGDIRRAKELSPLFGVEITSEMIQRAYEISFEKNGSIDTYRMSEIGEKPNPALVEKVYARIIEKHGERWMDSIKSLEQVTGVKPVFTEEQLQPIFDEFLQNGWFGRKGYIGVEQVTELTGLKPSVDLVEKAAIKIIDGGHGYIDQGKAIKEGIGRLRESTGVAFEIPEQEIQDRYQKAIADKKAHVISNLHGAFGIRPSVDKETARQFMVGLMDETYHNPIPELEKVFGVKFQATKEEIEAKQDENLEKLRFDGLAKIKELTGKDCDPKKLEVTLIQWLEKEATVFSEKRADYNRDWEKGIKQRLEQFNVTIPPEVAINIYTGLIQNETEHSNNLIKTCQLTGVPIPENLAQQAYQKYLSSDYAYSIKTGQGSSQSLGSVSGAFEELFKISGIKPEIPNDVLQSYYRSSLGEDSWYGRGIHSIQKIAEITGIKPEFDPNDINELYKQLVLSGKEDRIRNIREATGIELQLDEETAAYISQQIEAGIEKVRSGDYEKEEYREKKFDTYSLEQDLRKVGSLTAATGVRPDTERLQLAYSQILTSDPYWATKIEQIVKATGIKPVFSPEQLQTKGQQLLEQGSLRSFERLQAYGEFTFTPEVVAKTYDALLATNRRYDEYDRKHYYNEDWVDRIKRFKETTGIAPSETQLAAIFSHISQDGRIARSRYGDGVEEKIKFFVENFQTEITGGMVKDVAISYLARGDVNSMKKFIEKVGVTPEFTDEDLQPHISRLLEAKEFDSLAYLKQEMKLARIPASETAVQSAYQHFASQEDFGKESSKSLQAFKQIFELTGVPANFPAEQTDRVYKTTRFAEWQKLNEVIGTLPSNEVVQYKYLQFFTGGHYGLDKNIEAIRTLTGQSPEAETVSKALEHFASEGKIEEMSNIVKIAGGKPAINPESGQKAYRKITEQWNSSSSMYWGEKLVVAIDFLNDTLGIRPDSETMYQIYSKTFGQTDYKNDYEGSDGKRIYPQFWEFLVKKFGKPDPEVVQRIYLAQLAA